MDFIKYSNSMSLPIPAAALTPGPQYASFISAALGVVDVHDHTEGGGNLIPVGGLNITDSLSIQTNAAVDLMRGQFVVNAAPLTGLSKIFVALSGDSSVSDLFVNDGAGNPTIQFTKAGAVNATLGGLTGESYASGVFRWDCTADGDATKPANFDIATCVLRNISAGTPYGYRLLAPDNLLTSSSVTLPQKPASTFMLQQSSTDAMSADLAVDGITIENYTASGSRTAMRIKDGGLTAGKFIDASIEGPKFFLNKVESPSSGDMTISTPSGSPTDVITTSTITLANNRPVRIILTAADDAASGAFGGAGLLFGTLTDTINKYVANWRVQIIRTQSAVDVVISDYTVRVTPFDFATSRTDLEAPGAFSSFDPSPPAGATTYKMRVFETGNGLIGDAVVTRAKLVAVEL